MPTHPIPPWVLARRRQIGDQIREARKGHGWTQEQLAERADLDRTSIVRIERAYRQVKIDHLLLVADALGVPLSHLVRE